VDHTEIKFAATIKGTQNIKAVESNSLCGKICDMHTFVKYVKYAAIAYLHKTDMPILFANERNNKQSQQERRTTRSIERQTPVST